jgi:cobalt-zinc-cadmium efflux system outer membrane protein
MHFKIATLLLAFSIELCFGAQRPAMPRQHMGNHSMAEQGQGAGEMQQMQHGEMAPPAPDTGVETPVPDLLKDVQSRPSMGLGEFQKLALSTNPTLAQANALVRQSGGQARQAGLYPNPTAGYQGEQIRGGLYGGGEQGAFVQQTFVLGGKLGLRRNVYEQQRLSNEIGVAEQRYRVLSDVGQRFYTTLAAQELVNVQKRLITLARDAVTTAHQLANVGQADAPDVLQAEVEAEQAELNFTTAQRTYIQMFQSLAALVGHPEMELRPVQGDLEHPPEIDTNRIVSQIVENSPAVKRAQQQIVLAQAALKSARRESVPDLSIRGGVQQNLEPINETGRTPTGAQAFASAGISLPIFNRNQGNVAAANAELERSEAEVTRVRLLLRQDVQPLLQAYLTGRMQAGRYKNEMLPRAARAYQLYLAKYRQMAAAYPQVLVSQRTFFQLQAAYIHVLENVWTNVVALQNYTLSSGLSAPMPSSGIGTTINLPNSASVAQ